MQNSEVILVVVGASLFLSLVLSISCWRSDLSRNWKIVLTAVSLPPVIGPIMYLWIRNFPARPREELRGHGAGIGRRFLDAELNRKGDSESLYDVINEELAEIGEKKKHS